MRDSLIIRDRATTMALFVTILGATMLSGCVADGESSQSPDILEEQAAQPLLNLPPIGEDQEYAFYKGDAHTLKFPGFFTPQAETFFIWNLGTTIQHGAPYPSSTHGKLYGVFAPGPQGATHHVDGQDAFDHYHLMNKGEGTRTFDVFLVFPGPNFNAATFKAPLSEKALNTAVAAGILNAPLTTVAAGFPPLVIKVPVKEFEDNQH